MSTPQQPPTPAAPLVRPGRVDDLVLAMANRLIGNLTPGWRYVIAFVRPQLEPLVRRHLSKIRLPGAPEPIRTRIRRRPSPPKGGVAC